MTKRVSFLVLMACFAGPVAATAQIFESVGSRAMGMGGAFVAVATDSTASWWNPAAQAAGPFADLSFGRAATDVSRGLPARRDRGGWFTVMTPPVGFGYYHFSAIGVSAPTAQSRADRQDGGAGVPFQSLSVRQFGLTVVQNVLPGVHVGTTLKYLRGTVRSGSGDSGAGAGDLLDRAEDLGGGKADGQFDLDVGVMAVHGPVRAGAVVRNLREAEFADVAAGTGSMRLPRQVRAGVAFDAEQIGLVPLTLSFDADLKGYPTLTGTRRVVALGAEQWFATRRLGVRAGARFNTVGLGERAGTAGVSLGVRSGLYLEAHVVGGRNRDERGWGAQARVSF